jgi:alpha-mannosidase
LALREAEVWSSIAGAMKGFAYPEERMREAWRRLLVNQFHDILPGSSIGRVYVEAEQHFAQTLDDARSVADEASRAMLRAGKAIAVRNSLAWPRNELVSLPKGWKGVRDALGNLLPTQKVKGGLLAEVDVPSCGWTTLTPESSSARIDTAAVQADPRSLENEHLRVELNARGEIVSLFDKDAGRELAAGACNAMAMFKDVPSNWDAWDIDSTYETTPLGLPENAVIEVGSAGPLVASLRVRRKLHDSLLEQEIVLRRGSRRVDFVTKVDWHERHKMLKACFPIAIHANEAIHEIQFGHIRRPNHRSDQHDADRFEVCNHRWTALAEEDRGVAVLNDCKYGLNVLGGSINLTLLRAPIAPDPTADQGLQQFTYSLYTWNGPLTESHVVRVAYNLNVPVAFAAGSGGEESFFAVDHPNVVLETVKPAEDGSGDVVLRLYECMRTTCRARLLTRLPVASASLTNMLETKPRKLPVGDEGIELDFRPFEVKTVRLKLK